MRDLGITGFRRQCLSLLEDLPEYRDSLVAVTAHSGQVPVALLEPVAV
jgi:hypothetical protein